MSNLNGKIVFVTGATGFLGGALVHQLVSEGAIVKALARRPDRDGYIRDLKQVDIVMGDITDAPRMQELVQGCEIVFHCAATSEENKAREINIEGTRHIAEAAASAGVQRLVHVSTIAVYGFDVPHTVTEDTPRQPFIDPYSQTKSEAEDIVITIAKQHMLDYTIIRPGMIYGSRGTLWTKEVVNYIKFDFNMGINRILFPGDGSGTTCPVYVDDVADMMCVLATHPAASGEAFNCTPEEPVTWREFITAYNQLLNEPKKWFSVPLRIVKILLWIIARFMPASDDMPDFGYDKMLQLLNFILDDHIYDMSKSRRLLQWYPRTSLQHGIRKTKPYLREKGLLD